mgnify:CR=1 FL=1
MSKQKEQFIYDDHPKPSTLYILLLISALILFCIPFMIISFMTSHTVRLYLFPFLILVFLIFAIFFHAAVSTHYRLKNDKLYIRCGLFFTRLALSDIQRIHKKRLILRITACNSKFVKSFNNRFANGLLIITDKKQLYISPGQPKEFTLKLQEIHGKPFPYTTFSSNS